jgi:hypothetical protein
MTETHAKLWGMVGARVTREMMYCVSAASSEWQCDLKSMDQPMATK